jgi:hypothetical protein
MGEQLQARWTTPDFLAICPASVRAMHAYWESKLRGRRMPSRADLDPAEIVPFLPNILLVDVVSHDPLSLVYRVVGTREVEARGMDPTNRSVADAFYCRSLDVALANYRLAIELKAPVFDNGPQKSPYARLSDHGSIFLPLSEDDETVNKILVYTAFKEI